MRISFSPPARNRFFIFLLAFFAGFLAFYGLGRSSLDDWDECVYASVTAGMGSVASLSGTYAGGVWLDKPICGIWLHRLGADLFGLNNFGLRSMSSLAFTGAVLLLYLLLKRFYSPLTAFLTAAAFAVCPIFYGPHMARTANLDMYFLFFTVLAFYFYALSWERPRLFWAAGLAAGAAFMTRGYIAALIPLVVWLHWLFTRRGKGAALKFSHFTAAFLLAVLPWHIYSFVLYHDRFLDYYLGYQMWERVAKPIETHGGGGWYYYSYAFSRFSYFFYLFLAAAAYAQVRLFRELRREDLLWTIWFWVFFLALQLTGTKLYWYMTGLIPALFCFIPAALRPLNTGSRTARAAAATLALAYFAIFSAGAVKYIRRVITLPTETVLDYISRRGARPDTILTYPALGRFTGPGAQYHWIDLSGYRVDRLEKASDLAGYCARHDNFILVTDGENYRGLQAVPGATGRAVTIGPLRYHDGWGNPGSAFILDFSGAAAGPRSRG